MPELSSADTIGVPPRPRPDRQNLPVRLQDCTHLSIPQLIAENRRLRLLAEVADTVTRRLSLDHQLPHLIELIAQALDAERGTLFLYDRETHELFSRVVSGQRIAEIRIPATTGIAGAVFTAGTAEIIPDAYQDSRFNPEIDRHTGYRTRNILCVPLRNRDDAVIGVTEVLNKRSGDFGPDDLALAEAMTRQASNALAQALLVEQLERTECALQRTNRALRTLSRGNQVLGQAGSEAVLMSEMCRVIVEDGGYRLAWIGMPQHDPDKSVIPVAWAGDGAAEMKARARISWGDDIYGRGTCGRAIRSGEPQTSQDVAADPSMAPWHAEALQEGFSSTAALAPQGGRRDLRGADDLCRRARRLSSRRTRPAAGAGRQLRLWNPLDPRPHRA
ncbi:MAG: GAF domain-containing protein [Thiohalocapsa sp.]